MRAIGDEDAGGKIEPGLQLEIYMGIIVRVLVRMIEGERRSCYRGSTVKRRREDSFNYTGSHGGRTRHLMRGLTSARARVSESGDT